MPEKEPDLKTANNLIKYEIKGNGVKVLGYNKDKEALYGIDDSTANGTAIYIDADEKMILKANDEEKELKIFDAPNAMSSRGIEIAGSKEGMLTVDIKTDIELENSTEDARGILARIDTTFNKDVKIRTKDGVAVDVSAGKNLNFNSNVEISAPIAVKGHVNINSEKNINNIIKIIGNIENSGSMFLLNDKSYIVGKISNIENLQLSNGAKWNIPSEDTTHEVYSSVGNLKLDRGVVEIQKAESKGVSIKNLTGAGGTFKIKTDLAKGKAPVVRITDSSSGNHILDVENEGETVGLYNPLLLVRSKGREEIENMPMIVTLSEDSEVLNPFKATFSLSKKVEVGAYEYGLANGIEAATKTNGEHISEEDRQLHNWFLYPIVTSEEIKPEKKLAPGGKFKLTSTAQANLILGTNNYILGRIGNELLHQRLGEIHNRNIDKKGTEGWARIISGSYCKGIIDMLQKI